MDLASAYEREALVGELDLHTVENMSPRNRGVKLEIGSVNQFRLELHKNSI